MQNMFYNCRNLLFLDLSGFSTSNDLYIGNMFEGYINLILFDLLNFGTSNLATTINDNVFKGCNSKLRYCIFSTGSNSKLITEIQKYDFKSNNNCSDICFIQNKKIIFDNKTYELNCTESNKFDYKSICYTSCPEGNYNLSNNICIEEDNIITYNTPSTMIYNEYSSDISSTIINNEYPSDISSFNIINCFEIFRNGRSQVI